MERREHVFEQKKHKEEWSGLGQYNKTHCNALQNTLKCNAVTALLSDSMNDAHLGMTLLRKLSHSSFSHLPTKASRNFLLTSSSAKRDLSCGREERGFLSPSGHKGDQQFLLSVYFWVISKIRFRNSIAEWECSVMNQMATIIGIKNGDIWVE